MKTILVSAYAVNPYKGSEDGMGWNMICQIARFQKVIAITRENNQPAIEKYLSENKVEVAANIRFEYFDLPYYLRFWKKGGRGALLYFYLWQIGLACWVKRKDWNYDIAHNLNFHNDWTPSFLWILGKPFVWGPIGHHPRIPKQYIEKYGWKAVWKDKITGWVKQFFWKCEPFLKITAKKAAKVLVMNNSVATKLELDAAKVVKMPSVGSEEIEGFSHKLEKSFTVLSVGRFVPLKGFDLTIRSFAKFYKRLPEAEQPFAQLVIVGKGPFENQLRALMKSLDIQHAVTLINWIERDRLFKIYKKAKVFLFPSHEGAGMVVAEALSFGLPVLCFDNCGPGEFIDEQCGIKVPYQAYDATVDHFAKELSGLYYNRAFLQELSSNAVEKHADHFAWDNKGNLFKKVYENLSESVEFPALIKLDSSEVL